MKYHFGLTHGQRDAYDAAYWARDNMDAFSALMALFGHHADMGNPCVKQGEIEHYAREAGIRVDVIGMFRHNRNLYPGITRYMVMLDPRLASVIRFRKSRLDEVDMVSIWHEIVDDTTEFQASSRMEAERIAGER